MNETQGYQILTDKKGKQIAVETATGEVFDTFNAVLPVGSLIYTNPLYNTMRGKQIVYHC